MTAANEGRKSALGRLEDRFYGDLMKLAVGFALASVEPTLDSLGFLGGVTIHKFLRDDHPPRFPAPGGVEVVEVEDSEGPFGEIVAAGSGLAAWTAQALAHLPGRAGWRCYLASVDGNAVAAAATLVDGGVAQLGLAGTLETGGGERSQLALLRRQIEDASAAGARRLAADVTAGDEDAAAARRRDLRDAGFRQTYDRDAWVD